MKFVRKLQGFLTNDDPDSKVHGANMGPIWGQHDPGGPHVGPMNFAIWGVICNSDEEATFRIMGKLIRTTHLTQKYIAQLYHFR